MYAYTMYSCIQQVVCATLASSGHPDLVESVHLSGTGFDHCIIDEAAQAVETAILIPLTLGCKQLVLVGKYSCVTAC
jgi:superfamily I DNA and/or RNA helicase